MRRIVLRTAATGALLAAVTASASTLVAAVPALAAEAAPAVEVAVEPAGTQYNVEFRDRRHAGNERTWVVDRDTTDAVLHLDDALTADALFTYWIVDAERRSGTPRTVDVGYAEARTDIPIDLRDIVNDRSSYTGDIEVSVWIANDTVTAVSGAVLTVELETVQGGVSAEGTAEFDLALDAAASVETITSLRAASPGPVAVPDGSDVVFVADDLAASPVRGFEVVDAPDAYVSRGKSGVWRPDAELLDDARLRVATSEVAELNGLAHVSAWGVGYSTDGGVPWTDAYSLDLAIRYGDAAPARERHVEVSAGRSTQQFDFGGDGDPMWNVPDNTRRFNVALPGSLADSSEVVPSWSWSWQDDEGSHGISVTGAGSFEVVDGTVSMRLQRPDPADFKVDVPNDAAVSLELGVYGHGAIQSSSTISIGIELVDATAERQPWSVDLSSVAPVTTSGYTRLKPSRSPVRMAPQDSVVLSSPDGSLQQNPTIGQHYTSISAQLVTRRKHWTSFETVPAILTDDGAQAWLGGSLEGWSYSSGNPKRKGPVQQRLLYLTLASTERYEDALATLRLPVSLTEPMSAPATGLGMRERMERLDARAGIAAALDLDRFASLAQHPPRQHAGTMG